jgi:4-alpha-glucanotransferase
VTSAELRELARLFGIQLTYDDAAGKKRIASRESLEAALRAMLPDGAKLDKALVRRRAEIAGRAVEPVIVAWDGKLKLPKIAEPHRIILEDGERFDGRVLPFGYHTLQIGRKNAATIFSAPMKAPEPAGRTWGVFAPLHAIHTDLTWGAGDLGDMREYQQWLRSIGGDVVATLPLNAIFAEEDPSPYSPISRLYWNEMYLEVRRLPEYRGEPLEPLPMTDRVDYRQVMAAKRKLLLDLSRRFFEQPEEGFAEFARDTNDYALFRSRMESTHGLWRNWIDDDVFSFDAVRYHLYVQYRMSQQLGQLEGLYLDFPLGVHPNGYDAWRFDAQFARNVAVGAPPDLFFTKGQNWGFPPLHPDAIREHRHAYFRECVRRQLAHASVLRIDHVMGLHRLFWIPEGMEAKDGVYVRYPEDELYAVLTIEAQRSGSVIVGEDLGTVPQYVPKMMDKHGVHRMYVVQYEMKPEGANPAGKPPVDSVASINTHDMPPFSAFWNGKDIDDRVERELLDEDGAKEERTRREKMRRGLVKFLKARRLLRSQENDPRAVLEAVLRFLGESDAEIVLVNLEDLWLESEAQNVPGVPEHSWRQRMRLSLREIQSDEAVMRLLHAVDDARRKRNGNEKQKRR